MRRLAVVLAGMLSPLAGFAAPPTPPFLLRHGVMVDSVRGAAYVPKPNGTIDAVDLAGGRTMWTSVDAALPIGADQDLLVAQFEEKPAPTERFVVVIIDAASGKKVSQATITLPPGARALVSDDKGSYFRAAADREGATFLVSWYYQERQGEGARQSDEPEMRAFAGSARVFPQNGNVVAASGGRVGDAPGRFKAFGAPPAPPWKAGNVSARAEGGRGRPLTLKRNDAANEHALPDKVLSKQALIAVSSGDQRHLLATERVGQGAADDPEYRWLVFTMDGADAVAELRRDVSAAPFFLFGDSIVLESRPRGYLRGNVFVEEPLQLQAYRLSTDVPEWNIELRNLAYRGHLPPAR